MEYRQRGAESIAQEHVVREYVEFMTKHGCEVNTMEQIYLNIVRSKTAWPITMEVIPHEQPSLLKIVKCDDEILEKVILALSSLVHNMVSLVEEGQPFLYTLLYYGEGIKESNFHQVDFHSCAIKVIPVLQQLLNFVFRCNNVFNNILQQLLNLYSSHGNGPKYLDVAETHFKIIFECMGKILGLMVALDSVVTHNKRLRDHVAQFQHVIRNIQQNCTTFGTSVEDLIATELLLDKICENIVSGTSFLRCVSQNFSNVSGNDVFLNELAINIRGFLQDLSFRLSKEDARINLDILNKFLWTVCLYVLHAHMGSHIDKKILKTIVDLSKLVVAVPLVGPCLWLPEQFLSLYLPQGDRALEQKAVEAIASARFTYLRQLSQQLAKDVLTWNARVVLWLSRLSSQADASHSNQDQLAYHCSMIMRGQRLISEMNATVRLVLNLHLAIQPVISKTTVIAIFQTFELIKTVEFSASCKISHTPQAWMYFQHQLRRTAQDLVISAKKALACEKRPTPRLRVVFSALLLAENALRGPCTLKRVSVVRLSLAIACNMEQPPAFRDQDLRLLANVLQKMELLANGVQRRVHDLADCQFLYWHKSLLNTYLAEAHKKHFELKRINYALMAINDCLRSLEHVRHVDPALLFDNHEVWVQRALEHYFLDPLCREVETQLRLQTHSYLQPPVEENSSKTSFEQFRHQLQNFSLVLGRRQLNVKTYVEHFLSQTFYNLAAVAAYDWRKYSQMRLLVEHLFGVNPIEDRLPSQTLEQGLDVLEIMRNIQIFVSRFNYNLNNQFFVEMSSGSKHLNAIGIQHVSNSIRTHGSGIINTAVNFTYQFLRKKFFVFSQFLFDEHIKSRLMKDARYVRDLATDNIPGYDQPTDHPPRLRCSLRTMRGSPLCPVNKSDTKLSYPFERAEKFHRGIRKLGLTSMGLTYLDQFRILITHIGNALGYVRMLRSGTIHCSAESCAHVPDLSDLVSLCETGPDSLGDKSSTTSSSKEHSESNGNATGSQYQGLFESLARTSEQSASVLTLTSSRALDKVLDDLARSLSEGSDYFRLLVDVFRPFFRDSRHSHMRLFYVIVPPLTINFVEHIVSCKQKLNKKNRQDEATFTDDGLAMGIAYCLSALDQWKDFDTLHWFTSVQTHFEHQRRASSEASGVTSQKGQEADKLQQTLSLTLHRLDAHKQEFDLLFYSMNSARIFFRQENAGTADGLGSICHNASLSSVIPDANSLSSRSMP